MASSKAAPHPSGSRVLIAPIFSGEFLQDFVTDIIKREICKKAKQKKCTREHTVYNIAT